MVLRILCLHGHTQSASFFSKKMAVLRKSLVNLVEFDYLDAPHIVSPPSNNELTSITEFQEPLNSETPRTWWTTVDIETNGDARYVGVEESRKLIWNRLKTHGPYDGILGFSQGACMAGYIISLVESIDDTNKDYINLSFSILVSGFVPRDSTLHSSFPIPLRTPSLHIIGKVDTIVSSKRTLELLNSFASNQDEIVDTVPLPISISHQDKVGNAKVLFHPGGHFIPTSAQHRQVIKEFIEGFVNPPKGNEKIDTLESFPSNSTRDVSRSCIPKI